MAILSQTSRKRLGEISLAAALVSFCWLVQLAVLSKFSFGQVLCNLPLTFTIVWGVTFGSPLGRPSPDELRVSNLASIVVRQLLSGSPSGALIGALFASFAASVLPVYPLAYPIVGWMGGYFSLKNFNQAAFLIIPLVILFTFWFDFITAIELYFLGRAHVFSHLVTVVFPEALLNALIAPLLFIPMRGWFEFSRWRSLALK